jgi:hypothetical protein
MVRSVLQNLLLKPQPHQMLELKAGLTRRFTELNGPQNFVNKDQRLLKENLNPQNTPLNVE